MASIRDRKKLFKKTQKALEEFAEFIEMDLRENIIDNHFTGELSKSIKVKFELKTFTVKLQFAEYGLYLDQGTKPHWTSVNNLKEWATAHNVNVYYLQKKIAGVATRNGVKLPGGTKAHPWLYTWTELEFDKELQKMLDKGVHADLDNWVEQLTLKSSR